MTELTGITAPSRVRGALRTFLRWREAGIIVVAVGLIAYFHASTGQFLSESNLVNVAQYIAPIAIIATGEVLLLVSGQLDLSVGSVFALSPFLMYYATEAYGMPVLLGVLIALLASGVIGMVNGLVTVRLGVPPFVTTMGMLFLIGGLTLTVSGSYPRQIPSDIENVQWWLGSAPWAEICWALLIVLVFHLVLTRTRWGLHTIATGGNPNAAAEAGIRTDRVKIGNFVACSALAGFAGIIEAFRINTIDPTAGGTDVMFAAIAAAVIGGTALAGGSGTVLGALLGAVVLGVLQVGFNLTGISAYLFDLILGAAILLAMVANVRLASLRRAGGA